MKLIISIIALASLLTGCDENESTPRHQYHSTPLQLAKQCTDIGMIPHIYYFYDTTNTSTPYYAYCVIQDGNNRIQLAKRCTDAQMIPHFNTIPLCEIPSN